MGVETPEKCWGPCGNLITGLLDGMPTNEPTGENAFSLEIPAIEDRRLAATLAE